MCIILHERYSIKNTWCCYQYSATPSVGPTFTTYQDLPPRGVVSYCRDRASMGVPQCVVLLHRHFGKINKCYKLEIMQNSMSKSDWVISGSTEPQPKYNSNPHVSFAAINVFLDNKYFRFGCNVLGRSTQYSGRSVRFHNIKGVDFP